VGHVSTQGVMRPIIEPCLRYVKWNRTFGIPKCLQQCGNVGTAEVDIYNITYIKMYPCSLKSALFKEQGYILIYIIL